MSQFLQVGANTVLSSPKGNVTVSYEISNLIDISLTAFLLTDSDNEKYLIRL
jgi:tellurite resistance protein TerA